MNVRYVVLITLGLLVIPNLVFAQQTGVVNVEIFPTGGAHVVYILPVNGSLIVDLKLIGLPDPNFLVIVQNEKGEPLPYSINDTTGYMTIITLGSSQLKVDYYTSSITSKVAGRWIVNFTSPLPVILKLPPNATLSAIYTIPEGISTQDGSIVLSFKQGPVLIGYVQPPVNVVVQKPITPPSNPAIPPGSNTSSTTSPGTTPQSPSSPSLPSTSLTSPIILGAITLATVAVLVLFLLLRRRESAKGFSEVDAQIIELLRSAGGGLFQSELVNKLGLPTTTVWRHIRKLESSGIVVVEKRFGRNYIRLAR
ncbi:MAG: helix-turn-helix transcriptional regulator [Infirmifilum sp.]|uniref:helix-turn-helix transcriptional regulator n=1 Tax=Infirmifilum TaxID=2856573 RepID=UPI003C75540C